MATAKQELPYANARHADERLEEELGEWQVEDKEMLALKEGREILATNRRLKGVYNAGSIRLEEGQDEIKDKIEKAIEASRYILHIQENWDEEGSPGYNKETWERAIQFIREVSEAYINEVGEQIEPPKITPGPKGSIDVRWKAAKRSLLINFPASEIETADFFGSDKSKDTIKGTLDSPSQNLWILMWLTR